MMSYGVVREIVTDKDRDTCKFRVEVMHAATRKLSIFTEKKIFCGKYSVAPGKGGGKGGREA
jgi:hypothetical protein